MVELTGLEQQRGVTECELLVGHGPPVRALLTRLVPGRRISGSYMVGVPTSGPLFRAAPLASGGGCGAEMGCHRLDYFGV
jgi:hypothetical protein